MKQAGFYKGRGTRDQIVNLRIIMHKASEHQQNLILCFVDVHKLYDSVAHELLWILDNHDRNGLPNTYKRPAGQTVQETKSEGQGG